MSTKRTPQQIAEDLADRAYAAMVTARDRKAKATAEATTATHKYTRAEAKFQHAVTDIDVSDAYRDALAARMEAELAGEAGTAVDTSTITAPAAPSDGAAAPDPLRDAIHRAASGEEAMPAREVGSPEGTEGGPTATMKSGREDYIDGLPEGSDEGRPAVLEGTPDPLTDESADSSSVVPGEMPLV